MTSASSGRVWTMPRTFRDDRAHEADQAVAHLGHRHDDLALGGLDALGPGAVARARRPGRPLVPGPAEERLDLFVDGASEDQARAEPAELAEPGRVLYAIKRQRFDLDLDPGARRYPPFHGVGLLCGLSGPVAEFPSADRTRVP
jgi:hypothetical protein